METRMEAALMAVREKIGNDTSQEYHVARAILMGYEARWGTSEWEALAVEEPFDVPIVNPRNMAEHPYSLVGMVDTRIKGYGYKNVMLEHKTTKTDFSRPDTHYFDKLPHDQQISIYSLAAVAKGQPFEGTIYDVIRRPSIRPKKIPKGSVAKVVEDDEIGTAAEIIVLGTYWRQRCTAETEIYVTENIDEGIRESAELFGLRVLYNCLEFPDNHYHRTDLITRRNEFLLSETVPALWHIAEEISDARKEGKLSRFYQNSGSCYSFSSPCEFLSLCQGVSDTDNDEHWEPRQGGTVSGDGRLSTSSISCWMLCRRKFYYRYVKKIQRRGRKEPVATSIGSIIHTGLESWWRFSNERDSNREFAQSDTQGSNREA
jgi:hypothetical protein